MNNLNKVRIRCEELFGQGLTLVGGAGVILGGGVFLRQCFLWLRDGYWTPYNFRLFWQHLDLEYKGQLSLRGVNKIIDWILELPVPTENSIRLAGDSESGNAFVRWLIFAD